MHTSSMSSVLSALSFLASTTLASAAVTRGRPPWRPRARAAARPALVRSWMSRRSNCANRKGITCSPHPPEHRNACPMATRIGGAVRAGPAPVHGARGGTHHPAHLPLPRIPEYRRVSLAGRVGVSGRSSKGSTDYALRTRLRHPANVRRRFAAWRGDAGG